MLWGDMCQHGLTAEDEEGIGYALTNSPIIAAAVGKLCDGNHRHVHLVSGRAGPAARYTDQFCRTVCRALQAQLAADARKHEQLVKEMQVEVNQTVREICAAYPHCDDETESWQAQGAGVTSFFDDISGRELDPDLVAAAQLEEVDYFKRLNAYRKVPRTQVKETGGKMLSTRWVRTNKGDDVTPEYRCRLVAREIKRSNTVEMFAATPPLSSIRSVISIAASNQHRADPHHLLFLDVRRAYFFAPARRNLYIEVPEEDRAEGRKTWWPNCW